MLNFSPKKIKTNNTRQILNWMKILRVDFKKYISFVHKGVVARYCNTHDTQFIGVPSLTLGLNKFSASFSESDLVFFKNFNNSAFLKKFNFLRASSGRLTGFVWWIALWLYLLGFVCFLFIIIGCLVSVYLYFCNIDASIFALICDPVLFVEGSLVQKLLGCWVNSYQEVGNFFYELYQNVAKLLSIASSLTLNVHYYFISEIWWFLDTLEYSVYGGLFFTFAGAYFLGLRYVVKFFWIAYFNRTNVWPFLVHFLFSNNAIESFFSFNLLEQTFGSRAASVLASDFKLMGERGAVIESACAQLAYDFNANIGFAGYIGYIDCFPSYDSFLNYTSFTKMRVHVNKFFPFFRHFNLIGFFSKVGLKKSSINVPFRENYFLGNLETSRHTSLGKNLYHRPRFLLPLRAINILTNLFFFFVPTFILGDSEVASLREKIFFILLEGRDPWMDVELTPISQILPAQTMFGDSVDWYRRELNSVLLARTLDKKIKAKRSRTFKFGWQGLVNDYTFWSTNENFWDDSYTHNFYGNAEETEYENYAEFFGEGSSFGSPYNQWDYYDPDPEMGEEFDSQGDSIFFEDGLLHDDVESIIFEDEEVLLDLLDEGVYSQKGGYSSEDDEFFEFLGNQLLAYGGGSETDYMSTLGNAQGSHALLQPEYESKKQNMFGISSLFYEEMVDLYWLNSSCPTYKNFFEYPVNRYFNFQRFSKRYKLYLGRQSLSFGSKFFMHAPRHISTLIFPPLFYVFHSAIWGLLAGFSWFILLLTLGLVSSFSQINISYLSFCISFYVLFFFLGGSFCVYLMQPFLRVGVRAWRPSFISTFFIWVLAFMLDGGHSKAMPTRCTSIRGDSGDHSSLVIGASLRAGGSNFCEGIAFRALTLVSRKISWRNAALFRYVVDKPGGLRKMLGIKPRFFFVSFFFPNSFCNYQKFILIGGRSLVATLSRSRLFVASFHNISVVPMLTHFSAAEAAPKLFYGGLANLKVNLVAPINAHILFSDTRRNVVKGYFFCKPGKSLLKWLQKPSLAVFEAQIKSGLIYNSAARRFQLSPDALNNLDDGWLLGGARSARLVNPRTNLKTNLCRRRDFWGLSAQHSALYFSAQQFGGASTPYVQPYSNFLRLLFSYNYTESVFFRRFSNFSR